MRLEEKASLLYSKFILRRKRRTQSVLNRNSLALNKYWKITAGGWIAVLKTGRRSRQNKTDI